MELIVNNRIVETPIYDILTLLRSQLNEKGIDKLKAIIPRGDNIRITCPSHKNGQESHPSCSILQNSKGNLPKGFVSCFTCGYRATFCKFISDCFNIDDNGKFGEEWLLENTLCSFIDENRKTPFINIVKEKKVKEPVNYVSEKELESYRFYHPYMWKRKLTPEIVNKFDIGYDKETNSLTFPVYNNEHKCLFVVKRNVSNKFFKIPEGIEKAIFGLDQITPDINKVIICESVINALTCWVYGKPAIALFGTGTSEQIKTLLKSHIRHFVLGFDGDTAGRKATIKFNEALSKSKIITEYHLPQGKDINDLTIEEFNSLVEY